MFRLGPFSWFLIGWSFVLVGREQWAMLEAFYRRRARPRTVVYDRASPLAFAIMRLLSRLNGLDLLRFEESAEGEARPPLFFARDDAGARFTGTAALREVAQALPGRQVRVPARPRDHARAPRPALRVHVRAARMAWRASSASRSPLVRRAKPDAPSPIRRALRRARAGLRESALVWFAVCAVAQAIQENKSIPSPCAS